MPWTILLLLQQKKRDTIGLEPDQQSARRNSKFSICAAEKRSLHLHDKQDVCAGAEAAGGGGPSSEGCCQSAIGRARYNTERST